MSTQTPEFHGNLPAARDYHLQTHWMLLGIIFLSCFHWSQSNDASELCGEWEPVQNVDGGLLLSPGYPVSYPSNLTCNWPVLINGTRSLEFTFDDFDTGPSDSLSVYVEKPLRGTIPRWSFSGQINNESFLANQNVWFQLISSGDPGTSSRRFKIDFHLVFNETNECQQLSAPTNGYISGSDFSVGSEVKFSCGPGFQLQGTNSAICRYNNEGETFWSNLPPRCVAPCLWNKDHLGINGSFYSVPSNINILLSPNYPGNIIGPVSCAWEILASGGLNLTSDNLVSPDAPFALEIWDNPITDFLQPGLARNLILNITSFQETLSLSIFRSAVSVILKISRTSSIGHFVLNIQRVTAVYVCNPPPLTSYLTYYPQKAHYDTGDVITYKCQGTYALSTNRNTTNVCSVDGRWGKEKPHTLPVCSRDCLTWSVSLQAHIPIVFTSTSGQVYSKAYPDNIPTGICNYTFYAESGWVYTLELLSANLTTTELFIVEPFGYTKDWDTPIYSSKSNIIYLLVNQSSSHSTDFFIVRFHRERITLTCTAPANSDYVIFNRRNFDVGSTVTFDCEISFDVVRGNRRSCVLENSTSAVWWPDAPMCLGRCGGTYYSENITIVSPQFPNSYDSKHYDLCVWDVTNTKDVPFQISLSSMNMLSIDNLTISDSDETDYINNICTSNCSWFKTVTSSRRVIVEFSPSPERPTTHTPLLFSVVFQSTSLLMCENPGLLRNGQIIGNDFYEGSSIHYICHPPYDLQGPTVATCVRSSEDLLSWDVPTPRCVIKDCTPPSPPIQRTAGRGSIASPGYPGNILKGEQQCVWILTAREGGDRVVLHFRYIDLPADSSRAEEPVSVVILDVGENKNDLLGNFTSGTTPENVTSATNVVRVEYYGPSINTRGYRGIYLDYDIIPWPRTTTAEPFTSSSTKTILTSSSEETTTKTTESYLSSTTIKTTGKPSDRPSTSPRSSSTAVGPDFSTSTPSTLDRSTKTLGRTENKDGSNTGNIVAGIFVPIALIVLVGLFVYLWYRHKYPVRMVLGKDFGKFANPKYEKGASTLTLVREDAPKRVAE